MILTCGSDAARSVVMKFMSFRNVK